MAKRPYKPTALKVLEGNPGKRELVDEPMPAPAVALSPPAWLDEGAVKTWHRLSPILERLGLLCETDVEAFGHLCSIQSRLEIITERIRLIPDPRDETGDRLMVQQRQYLSQFRQYAGEFGLTPRGRAGLSVRGHGKEKNEMEGLLDD